MWMGENSKLSLYSFQFGKACALSRSRSVASMSKALILARSAGFLEWHKCQTI